jgi:hypothetical protein
MDKKLHLADFADATTIYRFFALVIEPYFMWRCIVGKHLCRHYSVLKLERGWIWFLE